LTIKSLENQLSIEKAKKKTEDSFNNYNDILQNNLENLKEIYESKINRLKNKIKKRDENLKELKSLIKAKRD